jgi:hypothetical protein
MTLREAGLAEGFAKVCLGDAFVHGFPRVTSGYASYAGAIWLFLASFKSTFLRVSYEC